MKYSIDRMQIRLMSDLLRGWTANLRNWLRLLRNPLVLCHRKRRKRMITHPAFLFKILTNQICQCSGRFFIELNALTGLSFVFTTISSIRIHLEVFLSIHFKYAPGGFYFFMNRISPLIHPDEMIDRDSCPNLKSHLNARIPGFPGQRSTIPVESAVCFKP